jgi:hypothetical protein
VEAFFISSPRWQRQVFDAPPPGQHLRLRGSLSTDSFCIRSMRLGPRRGQTQNIKISPC